MIIKHLTLLFFTIFSINLFWEISHSLLYNWNKKPLKNKVEYYIPRILKSTFGDPLFILIIFAIISILEKSLTWIYYPSITNYLTITLLGTMMAISVEIRALKKPAWSYRKTMPTIAKIGISPLLQLTLTFIISLKLMNFWIG